MYYIDKYGVHLKKAGQKPASFSSQNKLRCDNKSYLVKIVDSNKERLFSIRG